MNTIFELWNFIMKYGKNIRLNAFNKLITNQKTDLSLQHLFKRPIFFFALKHSCFIKSFYKWRPSLGRRNTFCCLAEKQLTTEYVNVSKLLPKQYSFPCLIGISQSISKYHISWILRHRFHKFKHFWNWYLLQFRQKKLTSH